MLRRSKWAAAASALCEAVMFPVRRARSTATNEDARPCTCFATWSRISFVTALVMRYGLGTDTPWRVGSSSLDFRQRKSAATTDQNVRPAWSVPTMRTCAMSLYTWHKQATLNLRPCHAAAGRASERVHVRRAHRDAAITVRLCHYRAHGRVRVAGNGGGATCRSNNRHDVVLLFLKTGVHLRGNHTATRVGPPLLLVSSNWPALFLLPAQARRCGRVIAATALCCSSSTVTSAQLYRIVKHVGNVTAILRHLNRPNFQRAAR